MLAKTHHPDAVGGGIERFRELQQAYDEVKKAREQEPPSPTGAADSTPPKKDTQSHSKYQQWANRDFGGFDPFKSSWQWCSVSATAPHRQYRWGNDAPFFHEDFEAAPWGDIYVGDMRRSGQNHHHYNRAVSDQYDFDDLVSDFKRQQREISRDRRQKEKQRRRKEMKASRMEGREPSEAPDQQWKNPPKHSAADNMEMFCERDLDQIEEEDDSTEIDSDEPEFSEQDSDEPAEPYKRNQRASHKAQRRGSRSKKAQNHKREDMSFSMIEMYSRPTDAYNKNKAYTLARRTASARSPDRRWPSRLDKLKGGLVPILFLDKKHPWDWLVTNGNKMQEYAVFFDGSFRCSFVHTDGGWQPVVVRV